MDDCVHGSHGSNSCCVIQPLTGIHQRSVKLRLIADDTNCRELLISAPTDRMDHSAWPCNRDQGQWLGAGANGRRHCLALLMFWSRWIRATFLVFFFILLVCHSPSALAKSIPNPRPWSVAWPCESRASTHEQSIRCRVRRAAMSFRPSRLSPSSHPLTTS